LPPVPKLERSFSTILRAGTIASVCIRRSAISALSSLSAVTLSLFSDSIKPGQLQLYYQRLYVLRTNSGTTGFVTYCVQSFSTAPSQSVVAWFQFQCIVAFLSCLKGTSGTPPRSFSLVKIFQEQYFSSCIARALHLSLGPILVLGHQPPCMTFPIRHALSRACLLSLHR
jgi:hypothetical protein